MAGHISGRHVAYISGYLLKQFTGKDSWDRAVYIGKFVTGKCSWMFCLTFLWVRFLLQHKKAASQWSSSYQPNRDMAYKGNYLCWLVEHILTISMSILQKVGNVTKRIMDLGWAHSLPAFMHFPEAYLHTLRLLQDAQWSLQNSGSQCMLHFQITQCILNPPAKGFYQPEVMWNLPKLWDFSSQRSWRQQQWASLYCSGPATTSQSLLHPAVRALST